MRYPEFSEQDNRQTEAVMRYARLAGWIFGYTAGRRVDYHPNWNHECALANLIGWASR